MPAWVRLSELRVSLPGLNVIKISTGLILSEAKLPRFPQHKEGKKPDLDENIIEKVNQKVMASISISCPSDSGKSKNRELP